MTGRLFEGAHVRVSVPATSANLGPGYDCLGLALEIRDVIDVRVLPPGERSSVEVFGEGRGVVPDDATHLVLRMLTDVLARLGFPDVPVRLECRNAIPHARGLGSSAAAVVAAITAADALAVGAGAAALRQEERLALAVAVEGHPDNAAPALLGGAAISWMTDGAAHARRIAVHEDVHATVIVPADGLSTAVARSVLPKTVSHADAAHNAARAALLVHALGSEPGLLPQATEDLLHQPYRRDVLPGSLRIIDRLRRAGLAAVLSGAGPSVLVLGTGADDVRPLLGDEHAGTGRAPAIREIAVARRGVAVE